MDTHICDGRLLSKVRTVSGNGHTVLSQNKLNYFLRFRTHIHYQTPLLGANSKPHYYWKSHPDPFTTSFASNNIQSALFTTTTNSFRPVIFGIDERSIEEYHRPEAVSIQDSASVRSQISAKSEPLMSGLSGMASSRALHETPETAGRTTRSDEEIERHWDSVVTQYPVSNELQSLVRADLKKAWHFLRVDSFRHETRIRWATTDEYRIRLDDMVGNLDPEKLSYLCNKPTAFYWLQSAQQTDATGEKNHTPKIILAAIYDEWRRCYNNEPNIEFGHFFANPVRITSTCPPAVAGVIEAHHSLCFQASSLINQVEGRADNLIERQPSSSQHYSVLPLYHALVVIIDRLDSFDHEECRRESDGLVSLRKIAQHQTVLIARTGVEEGLHESISFESLKSHSLPSDRFDVVTKSNDVVRVSLATAVQFITDLEKAEDRKRLVTGEELPLDTGNCPVFYPKEFETPGEKANRNPEAWADGMIKAAEKYGYDNDCTTRESIRRV
ncbi:hypothetical protein D0Z07_4605 [Hyphodiscus hymeniophilus]|uniref:Uncharacterized protein n=1 Tax=Hyphodiscus hymeniophilus TaxID=353542 RepID=A0A9P6VIP6_9HELO|nr:hypothetical protein D0Z07_4605 [Hyphodiscus hymeniophilus]